MMTFTGIIQQILDWLISFYQAFLSLLMNLMIDENGVSVGSVMIVLGVFALVVSNLVLIAKRN